MRGVQDEDKGPWRVTCIPVALFSGIWVFQDLWGTGMAPFFPMAFFALAVGGIVRTYTD